MVAITGTCYYWNSRYCQSCAVLLVTRTCSSRIAPQLTALATLQQETPEFNAPDLWPPNSPDLNPVDYRVWGLMQDRVYKTAVRDTADFKRRLIETWSGIPQTVIDEVIDEWATTKSLHQSKGTSLRALAATNRLLSEPPNATTLLPALFRDTHILSKIIAMSSYA